MKKLLLLFVTAYSLNTQAQTWSDDVATIVYNKCSTCHHPGGIGPFSLMDYTETSAMQAAIYDVVANDQMPPWPPDNSYQQYSHNRSLSPSEKTTVLNWLVNGAQEGNAGNTPPPPIFNTGSILGSGDLEVKIPTYASKAQGGQDDYVCFSIPTNLTQNRVVRAMEIIPGNREIVHHALIYFDETGTYPTDTIGGDCMGPQNATLMTGYTPGASPLIFPNGNGLKLGMTIPAGSNIVFGMHYPAGSYGMIDSTKVIFHFYPTTETGIREVYCDAPLQNWSLSLPPNQITNTTAHYPNSGGLPVDISVLSVFPHMHLIGERMKAYGLTPSQDTIPFINVNHWDFHWQDFYFFKNIQKAPAGSTLHAEARYNNTTSNLHNPNNPPVWVYAGEGTTDEMMMVYCHYMMYQNGDENYNLEDLMNLGLSEVLSNEDNTIQVGPNPFDASTTITINGLKNGDQISCSVYDYNGKLVRVLAKGELTPTTATTLEWNGTNQQGTTVRNGVYFVSIAVNGKPYAHQRLIKASY